VDYFVGNIEPVSLRPIVRAALVQGRKLDHGNPNPGNIGADFGRLGLQVWANVNALDLRNQARQAILESLNTRRNAIAHQDWRGVGAGLQLPQIQSWRSACRALAPYFDRTVGAHLAGRVGGPPW
jgi:hypothetical protein